MKHLPRLLREKSNEEHAALLTNLQSVVNAIHWRSEAFPSGTAYEHTLLEIATVLRLRPPGAILNRIRDVHGGEYVEQILRLESFIS